MKHAIDVSGLLAQISTLRSAHAIGRVAKVEGGVIHVSGLTRDARIGDMLSVKRREGPPLGGEVVQISGEHLVMLADDAQDGIAIDDRVVLLAPAQIAPSGNWIGRIIDSQGCPLDGRPLLRGATSRNLRCRPPAAADRLPLGSRMSTGLAVMNTLLPVVRGQRLGLFAGSGVGKSSLLGQLAQHMDADVVVIAMIGERGRELRHFVEETLGPKGLARAVIVAATSDQSALVRRRSAWAAMAVAEHFRDEGKSVLLLADSITRFAEAHREVAVAAGEAPVLRGYPPSTSHQIMSLCERAGPGVAGTGSITGIFSVLVAGSDMDEPVADILRGVLDGHVVLDRAIAERGRYPAIDVLRSVSRSLPAAASAKENEILSQVRKYLGIYDRNAMMIRAGLYAQGSDAEVDKAIQLAPELDAFLVKAEKGSAENSFAQLELVLRRASITFGQAGSGLPRRS